MYEAYIFDLYGTLVDIHTDEDLPYLWEKMSELYAAQGAVYEPEELKAELRRLETVQADMLKKDLAEEQAGVGRNSQAEEHLSMRQANAPQESLSKEQKDMPSAGDATEEEELCVEPDLTSVFAQLYEKKGHPVSKELARMTAITFRALSREYLRVYPGVKETLEELRRQGKGVYLLSNAQRDFTRPELEMLGLTGLFDGILISSEERVKKPSKQFFDRLVARYGLDPNKCLMVGNEERSEIEGAARAGMDSLYSHTNGSPNERVSSRET